MTARIRRWTRRRKPNDLSDRLAAVRRHRTENLGSIKNDLLGEDRLREMVAVALFLILSAFRVKNLLRVPSILDARGSVYYR